FLATCTIEDGRRPSMKVADREWNSWALRLILLGAGGLLGIESRGAAADEQKPATLQGHSKAVLSVAFSPDGKTLASASADHTIKLWDVASAKVRATLQHTRQVLCVAFSPDGKTLASGANRDPKGAGASALGWATLWDVATGQEKAKLD